MSQKKFWWKEILKEESSGWKRVKKSLVIVKWRLKEHVQVKLETKYLIRIQYEEQTHDA